MPSSLLHPPEPIEERFAPAPFAPAPLAPAPSSPAPSAPAPLQPVQPAQGEPIAQALILCLLFAAPALIAVRAACVYDPDIWWHLRTGQWILNHRTVPYTDSYTSFASGKPWAAYSWLFDLIVYKLFARLGLVGLVAYTASMLLLIAVALHHMIRRLHSSFSHAVLLTFAGCCAMTHLLTPRPWHFTILFFFIELDILMHVRRTGKLRELAWLPVIFALWANLHVQFVDGLIVLGLACIESLVAGPLAKLFAARFASRLPTRSAGGSAERSPSDSTSHSPAPLAEPKPSLPASWALAALGTSVLATLVNPYAWHIYRTAYDLASQPGVLDRIDELHALPFRDLGDFLVLGFALATAAALARMHARMRSVPVFELLLFALAVFASFRSQRDVWIMVGTACAILATALPAKGKPHLQLGLRWTPALIAIAALAVGIGFRAMHVTNLRLQPDVAREMPVAAVHFAQAHQFPGPTLSPGPVFNDFGWGGYLIWALRQPVAIDGRAALAGDQRIDRSIRTWNGEPDWASDPDLRSASMVLGRSKAPLTQLLRADPGFTLVYEDTLAAIFVPIKPHAAPQP